MAQYYYIWTIGCQMNKAESERIEDYLEGLGYQPSARVEDADLVLLNTCVVRQSAEDRVINKLHSLKIMKQRRPQMRIALTGCIIGPDNGKLKKLFPFVDHFSPAGGFVESWKGDPSVELRSPQDDNLRNERVASSFKLPVSSSEVQDTNSEVQIINSEHRDLSTGKTQGPSFGVGEGGENLRIGLSADEMQDKGNVRESCLPGEGAGTHKAPQVATYVPIMQGCNNFCSYCVVPYRRGRERSRPPEEIVSEVIGLVHRGVKEVTLLGQNVNSYGLGLPGEPDLADLLGRLNSIEGLLRIRFLTNHPKDMQPRLIEAVANLDKVCEQINLPVQSGDNDILRAMHRGYSVDRYRELIQEIRARVPQICLSTDVIVGFPGETEAQFENTFNLLEEIRFDVVHAAAYSPRPDTLAARTMEDNVPAKEKKQRLNTIEQLQARIAGERNAQLKDKVVEVLVERKEKGKWCGRTRGDKLVFFGENGDYKSKQVNVKINHTSPWSLTGSLERNIIIANKNLEEA